MIMTLSRWVDFLRALRVTSGRVPPTMEAKIPDATTFGSRRLAFVGPLRRSADPRADETVARRTQRCRTQVFVDRAFATDCLDVSSPISPKAQQHSTATRVATHDGESIKHFEPIESGEATDHFVGLLRDV
jgi:hypothetical protein